MISIKLQSNFIEITLQHGGLRLNLLNIFRMPIYKNTYGGLRLEVISISVFYGEQLSLVL